MEDAMTIAPVKTWAQVTKDSEALDEVRAVITSYLPPGSRVSEMEALARIIEAIERRTGIKLPQQTARRMS
jgi:hypothetical protein